MWIILGGEGEGEGEEEEGREDGEEEAMRQSSHKSRSVISHTYCITSFCREGVRGEREWRGVSMTRTACCRGS